MSIKSRNGWWIGAAMALILAAGWFLSKSPLRHRDVGQQTVSSRSAADGLRPARQPSLPKHVDPLRSVATTNIAQPAKPSERLKYRLTNTPEKLAQLIRNDKAILLENALIDTAMAGGLKIPEQLRSKGEPGSYIVQSKGPIDAAFRSVLKDAGAEVISYIPNNAYLVRIKDSGMGRVTSSSLVQAVLPYEPYFKLDRQLIELAVEKKALPADLLLKVTLFPGDQTEGLKAITGLKGQAIRTEPSPFKGQIITVQPSSENWIELARLPEVQMVETYRSRVMLNDLSRVRLGVAADTLATTTNYLGLTGTNVLVSVTDSGVDSTHPDLAGRVFADTALSLTDLDGHGTHVAGIIASSGTNSPPGTNASGSIDGANFRGMAPSARIFAQPLDIFGGPVLSDSYFQQTAARTNAFISNNSWAYVGSDGYDLAAASYDSAVRDALPGSTGSQPLLLVFAAGNSGGGSDNGLNAFSGTISSPATAKNVITVGAIENLRNITNEYTTTTMEGTNVITVTNVPFLGLTDSDAQVASFSSRGNVGAGLEGDFGRFKPDVMAPGTFVVSTRSTNWIDPTITVSLSFKNIDGQSIDAGKTNVYPITVPPGGVQLIVRVDRNLKSPDPLPLLPILISQNQQMTPADFKGNGLAFANVTPGTWYFGVGNPGKQLINVDLQAILIITNDSGGYLATLKQLNDKLAPFYRYESGTSMAAPAVAGTLALMQEFFEQRLQRTNSPALMKALLINGARPVSSIYDFAVASLSANHQGWGLVNLANSIPEALASTNESAWPLRFYDQSPTNALATGQSQTRLISLSPQAQNFGLRVSLVWTDPPGNPAASVKLVNDLDLTITNLESGEVFVGNNFPAGENYTGAGVDVPSDVVNNVENIFLNANFFPLGASNSITVRAKRVNVNAVSSHPNGIVQDYALVISSENLGLVSPFTITEPVAIDSNLTPGVTTLTNGVPLLGLRIGANSPLSGNTNGVASQWRFFTLTNDAFTGGSNVAVATFFPPNLSNPRFAFGSFGASEADIDLYVSLDPNLTNLVPSVLDAAMKSRNRLGTETVVLTNAPKNGEVYYIGVKSEDQQAGEFGLFAIATDTPFEQRDADGNLILNGVPIGGVDIPDGSPEKPQAGLFFAISTQPDQVRRLIVTNQISHELIGDLVGILAHNQISVGLNSHTSQGTNFTQMNVYDDSGQHDLPLARTSDGPGSLLDYLGERASGLWLLTQVDNASGHTGRIDRLTLKIEPKSTNEFNDVNILANSFFYDFFDVPSDVTNVTVTVGTAQFPVEVYLRRGALPTRDVYDKTATINPIGGTLSLSIDDSPSLNPGRYFVGFYNPNATTISIRYSVKFDFDLAAKAGKVISPTNSTTLGDDVLNVSTLTVTNDQRITDIEVGVHIEHPRVSDLTLHLVSPQGTRILLAENRGGLTGTNYGGYTTSAVTTNLSTIVLSNGFENADSTILHSAGFIVSGWRVDRSNIEVYLNGQSGQTADTGTNCIDLNGGQSGMISTNLVLLPGKNYRLSFAYARNPDSIAISITPQAAIRVGGSTLGTITANQLNTWAALNWQHTSMVFQASVATNLLQLESLQPTASGVMLDSFVVQQMDFLTNSPNSYATFTENTNRSPILIKFASPPFGSGATFAGGPVFFTGFEGVLRTNFGLGQTVDGWTVLSNSVEVINGSQLGGEGTNSLAVSSGSIVRTVSTRAGGKYRIRWMSRDNGVVSWWPGDSPGVANDLLGGNNGVIQGSVPQVPGQIQTAFSFNGNNANYIDLPNSASMNVATNGGLTIEGWIKPLDLSSQMPIFEWKSGGVGDIGAHFWVNVTPIGGPGSLYVNLIESSTVSHAFASPPNILSSNNFQHVALTWDQASGICNLYLNGTNVASRNFGLIFPKTSNGAALGRRFGSALNEVFNGLMDDMALYRRALSSTEIKGLASSPTLGKYSSYSVQPNLQLNVNGVSTNVIGSPVWATNEYVFYAAGTNTDVRFSGNALGMLLDSIEMTELSQTNAGYYLPEESLKAFIGENALGDWKLEIQDTRAGAVGLAKLVDWNLNLTFARVNPVATLATNGVSFTNTIEGANLAYFAVDVPGLAGFATNSLLSLTGGNLDLIFNQNALPTGSRPTDFGLLAGVPAGTSILTTNSLPPALQPGQRYYLAVRNTNPAETNTFVLRVDFDRVGSVIIDVPTLTNGFLLSTNIAVTNALQYFQFDVSTNATSVAFEIFRNSGNVNLVISKGLPLPTVADFDYFGFNPSTTNELAVVLTNSSPVALAPGRWYLGVYNLETVPVTYVIRATEESFFTVTNITDLVIDVPTNAVSGPGAVITNFYRVVIDQTNSAALFEIFGLAGDVDLYARRGALPTVGLFDFRSRRSGPFPEQIIVQTNNLLTDLNGEWFLGVPNSEITNVSFTISATVATNGFLISKQAIQFTNVLVNGVALNFTVGPGVLYTNVFRFTIDQTNSAALFELYGLSGNVDLLLSRGGIPSPTINLSSLNTGTNPEVIVINTNLLPVTDINGDWFLAVPNNETFDVTFTIRAVVSTNVPGGDILFSAQPLRFTSPPALTPGGNMQFSWNTLPGENYQVQTSPDLVTWSTIATITATTTNTVFTDPAPATGTLFYRIIQVP